MREWTFIANHGLILAYIWEHPRSTAREIASSINVTEWTVRQIITQLEKAGYLERKRSGRNNIYHVNLNGELRHHANRHAPVGDLLRLLVQGQTERPPVKR